MAAPRFVLAAVAPNPFSRYSLVNSVDFHPSGKLLVATFINRHGLAVYRVAEDGGLRLVQRLGLLSGLRKPEHGAFTPDGRRLFVVDWSDGSFLVFACRHGLRLRRRPMGRVPLRPELAGVKPHGITVSPDGLTLAVAYGVTPKERRAVALLDLGTPGWPIVAMAEGDALPGVPKGIDFTPDGTHLLVSFSDTHSLAVFAVDRAAASLRLVQHLRDPSMGLARPEDIRLTADGAFVVATNTGNGTLSLLAFDPARNRLAERPAEIVGTAHTSLTRPHGIAFSDGGRLMAVSDFGGTITLAEDGHVYPAATTRRRDAQVKVFRVTAGAGARDIDPAWPA